MNSEPRGLNTSDVEITNVSRHGVWMLVRGRELFMSYEDFPWFMEAPIGKVLNVQEPTLGHFHWPELDIDLGLETIEHPGRFPRKARSGQ